MEMSLQKRETIICLNLYIPNNSCLELYSILKKTVL